MNLLLVSAVYPPFVGGASTFSAEMAQRAAADGHRVRVLSTDILEIDRIWSPHTRRVENEAESGNGVQIARMRCAHLPGAPYSFYLLRRLMPELARIAPLRLMQFLGRHMPGLTHTAASRRMLSERFDAIHLINITLESPLLHALKNAVRDNTPLLCTPFVHVGAAHVLRNYVMPHQLDLMRRSATVFVQTMREQQALAGLGVPHTAMRMLGMGVNPESAAGADGTRFRLAHGIAATTPLVLFMGSVTYDKGAVTLLAAMQRLWQHGSDAMAVIVGEAPKPGGFTAALAQVPAQWRDRVKRIDVLRGQDKHDAFAAADVFTLPSRVDSFGIVFLEAWLHGKPVIGADAGGIPEVITHEQDGFVLPFGDAEALAGHIHMLIDNPERAAALGARGRENVLARHNWARIYRVVADATHAHARS